MTQSQQRLIVLSLDGIDAKSYSRLKKIAPALCRSLENLAPCKVEINSHPFTNAQAIWAQILTGKSWSDYNCPGYSIPNDSLNNALILSESNLPASGLVNYLQSASHASINMPLLIPGNPSRIWLSDGSLPVARQVFPDDLLADPLIAQYKARPFAYSVTACGQPMQSARQLITHEVERISLATRLALTQDWAVLLWRITAFDELAHLLGDDYLYGENLSNWPDIEQLLHTLTAALEKMLSDLSDVSLYVVSAYSLKKCRGVIDLNKALVRGGYCSIYDSQEMLQQPAFRQRMLALAAINKMSSKNEPLAYTEQSLSKPLFDTGKTLAASPTQGAIYINLEGRFKDGCVKPAQATKLMQEMKERLPALITVDGGAEIIVTEAPHALAPSHNSGPDLLISGSGFEFIDFQKNLDRLHHPLAVHSSQGFALVPEHVTQNQTLTPFQLGQLLYASLTGRVQ